MIFRIDKMKTLPLSAMSLVAVLASTSTSQAESATVRGVIHAVTQATISADYSASIKAMPYLDGTSFKKGDILVAFDCERFRAEIVAAEANTRAKQLIYLTDRKLLAKGALGANEARIAEAEYEQARAGMMAAEARISSCEIRAPFDGRVEQRIAQLAESPAANQPIIRIIDTTSYEVEVIMPSKWLRQVEPGRTFAFLVDDTGESLKVSVSRIGAAVDPVSQTIRIFGIFQPGNTSVLPGMSGTATFTQAGS